MGKGRNGARQEVCNLTETNSVVDMKLEAFVGHAESQKELAAWGLNSFQQAIDERTGRYVQFISDRSFLPLKIYKSREPSSNNVSIIASQTEDQEMVFLEEGRKKDGRLLWIAIITGLLVLVLCLAVYLKMKGG